MAVVVKWRHNENDQFQNISSHSERVAKKKRPWYVTWEDWDVAIVDIFAFACIWIFRTRVGPSPYLSLEWD